MFVITADQIDSRNDRDRAGELITTLNNRFGDSFILPPDQTSGDEIQVMMADAAATFDVILAIHRTGYWRIGLGVGNVRMPLAASTRQSAGSAFIYARDAVTRGKKSDARFGMNAPASGDRGLVDAPEVEALFTMLLLLRQRRTDEGWEAVDLLQQGLSQARIAAELSISTAAVSQRVKAALWRVEDAVRPALVRLLENLDHAISETEPAE